MTEDHPKKDLERIQRNARRLRIRRAAEAAEAGDVVAGDARAHGGANAVGGADAGAGPNKEAADTPAEGWPGRGSAKRGAAGRASAGRDTTRAGETGDGPPIRIEQAGQGRVCRAGGATCYVFRRSGDALDPHAEPAAGVFGRLSAWPDPVAPRRGATPPFDPAGACFLDIETTGLSPSTYLFLIGLMYYEDGRFVSEQAFARDYAEEAGVLAYTRRVLSRFPVVVTYNGDHFDLPFIATRMDVHRIERPRAAVSIDLLAAARRLYRGVLPNCRLGTVERHIRGIDRTGDIPGAEIPRAYHDFVRTDDARAMRAVLYHNRMDLFTMAVLVARLGAEAEGL